MRQMALDAIAGSSNGKIARWLNAEGISTVKGCKWAPEVVGELLRDPALADYATLDGERSRR